jgi:NAD(P)-dependent dehydrogenase (short-subunit alcohol dehydrogenase family)
VDLLAARQLGVPAALTVFHGRLHRRQLETVETLQRGIRPGSPPDLPGLEISFRYQPAAERVGGDWFDVIPLPGSRVALVGGDVMGHGLAAAVVMGRLRTAVQTLASLDLPAEQVLHSLDEMAQRLAAQTLTTCVYCVYDPVLRRCTIANAGHLPPVLVRVDGKAEVLTPPRCPPIGLGRTPFETMEIAADDDSMLVRLVRRTLTMWGLEPMIPAAQLLASELVTNAVRQTSRPITIRLMRTDALLYEVSDDDHRMPIIREPGALDEDGRGLYLVSQLADRWGPAGSPEARPCGSPCPSRPAGRVDGRCGGRVGSDTDWSVRRGRMRVQDKVVVVTGAASGIGRAMALRFAAEGAAGILVADLDEAGAAAVAEQIGDRAVAVRADVSVEEDVRAIVDTAERSLGPIGLFCSNAGIITGHGVEEASDEEWSRTLAVNTLAHVYAARAVIPAMVERGGGYLLNTCSAAGLVNCPGDAPYAVSKAAAISFAEWVAIHYRAKGIGVSVLCPQGVRTGMMREDLQEENLTARAVISSGAVLEPEEVAGHVVDGLDAERFYILPHPEVAGFFQMKASDPDRWLSGMSRFVESLAR